MQRPTHHRLHVRDARDAHIVFEAVRLGLLQRVERRLNEIERSMYIRSGAIFVWEECDDDLGLKRWTDGRIWSQSRMREVKTAFARPHPARVDTCVSQSPTCSTTSGYPQTNILRTMSKLHGRVDLPPFPDQLVLSHSPPGRLPIASSMVFLAVAQHPLQCHTTTAATNTRWA